MATEIGDIEAENIEPFPPLAETHLLETAADIRTFIEHVLEGRLKRAGLATQELKNIIGLLPIGTRTTPETWKKIVKTPMLALDDELVFAFLLERKQSPIPKAILTKRPSKDDPSFKSEFGEQDLTFWGTGNHAYYYIRSFKMTKSQVVQMINSWWANSILFDEMEQWAAAVDDLQDRDIVHLRYIGMTTREKVTDRHVQDLAQRKSGPLSHFQSYLFSNLRSVLLNTTIMELHWDRGEEPDATTETEDLASYREQALIALLGPNTLLNRQPGGDRYQFAHDATAWKDFRALKTRSFQCLMNCVPAHHFQEVLYGWSVSLTTYMHKTFDPRMVSEARVTREFLNQIISNCRPVMVGKFNLCLQLLSGAPPLHSFKQNTAFWQENSRSSEFTISCLTQLFAYEGFQVKNLTGFTPICSRLPVQNFFNWPSMAHTEDACHFLNEYLDIAPPLIVLAYGRQSTYYCLSGYQHLVWAAGKKTLTDIVGEPYLINSPRFGYTIVIPCFHPGRNNYSAGASIFRQVFQTAHMVFLLTIHYVFEEAKIRPEDRKGICQTAFAKVKQALQTSALDQKLQNQRSEMRDIWTKSRAKLDRYKSMQLSAKARANHEFLCLENFRACGSARESGDSAERLEQAEKLWIMNIPSLHLSIEHTVDRKAEWIIWISSIRHSGSYYVRALEVAPLQEFERLLEPWIDSDARWRSTWSVSPAVRREVANSAYWDWLSQTTWTHDPMLAPPKPQFPKSLNGHILRWTRKPSGTHIRLDFQDLGGNEKEIIIEMPSSLKPKDEDDLRTVTFTGEGIIFKDNAGKMLVPKGKDHKKTSTVSYDLAGLGAMLVGFAQSKYTPEGSLKLIELWERETGKSYDEELAKIFVDQLPIDKTKAMEFGKATELKTLDKGVCRVETLSMEKAPEPTDGAWLLWQFLLLLPASQEERRFCISDPRLWPETKVKNFWTEFRKFLYKAEYMHHPQIRLLRAYSIRAVTQTLARGVKAFCPKTTIDSQGNVPRNPNDESKGPKGLKGITGKSSQSHIMIGPTKCFSEKTEL